MCRLAGGLLWALLSTSVMLCRWEKYQRGSTVNPSVSHPLLLCACPPPLYGSYHYHRGHHHPLPFLFNIPSIFTSTTFLSDVILYSLFRALVCQLWRARPSVFTDIECRGLLRRQKQTYTCHAWPEFKPMTSVFQKHKSFSALH
jgi:hypothetical protein